MAWNSTFVMESYRIMDGHRVMEGYRFKLALLAVGVVLSVVSIAQQTTAPGVVALTPAEMTWASQGVFAVPGMEQLNLVGDPTKPGPYTLRLKFPKGFRIRPHTH